MDDYQNVVNDHRKRNDPQFDEGRSQLCYVHLLKTFFDTPQTKKEQNDEGIIEFGVDDDIEGDQLQIAHESRNS